MASIGIKAFTGFSSKQPSPDLFSHLLSRIIEMILAFITILTIKHLSIFSCNLKKANLMPIKKACFYRR
jgi:hypothetical protein